MKKCILCFGDSNTYGYDPGSYFGGRYGREDRWPEILAGLTGYTVINMGENGRSIPTADFELRLLETEIKKHSPGLIILMLGSNDILLRGKSAGQTAADMEGLTEKLKNDFPGIKILLLSPPGTISLPPYIGHSIAALPGLYEGISLRQGTDFLDVQRLSPQIGCDGVHLTPRGHRVLAEKIFEYIKNKS